MRTRAWGLIPEHEDETSSCLKSAVRIGRTFRGPRGLTWMYCSLRVVNCSVPAVSRISSYTKTEWTGHERQRRDVLNPIPGPH